MNYRAAGNTNSYIEPVKLGHVYTPGYTLNTQSS